MKVLVLLIFVISVFYAESIMQTMQCYYCSGSLEGDCAQGNEDSMVKVNCGRRDLTHVLFKREAVNSSKNYNYNCVQFKRSLPGNAEAFVRGCAALPTRMDPCKYIENKMHASDCTSCNTTLCNAHIMATILIPDDTYTVDFLNN